MPPILAPFLVVVMLLREVARMLRQPKYRSVVLWVATLLAVGTVFYSRVEGWSLLDSVYFSVVTLATVGYGDLTPTTELGKAFTTVYILLGLGIIATFASMLASERAVIYEERFQNRNGEPTQDAG